MSFGSSGSGGGQAQNVNVQPYAAAQPALNQIISEAGQVYNQGVTGAGYVAPTSQTTTGLAQQETLANAANTQISNTLAGNYLNPYLNPMLQDATSQIANSINTEFSGAGRTPGSPLNQQEIIGQVADYALPLAFQQYNTERDRQLNIAQTSPTLLQTGQQLEALQRQQNLAPFQSLQQYAGLVSPIASGFPVQSAQTQTQASPVTTALGGALIGSRFGGTGAVLGGIGGLLGGLL